MTRGDGLANKTEKIQLIAPDGPTKNEREKKKMKEKAKVNNLIRIYTEEGDYLIENPYRVTHIDRRFLPKKLYYEAQSLDGLIDIKFLEETEFEKYSKEKDSSIHVALLIYLYFTFLKCKVKIKRKSNGSLKNIDLSIIDMCLL